ncbi:MAG TPA: ribokinase [Thermomicrobiales bacterium]|nr:ribokinase [Thermomicrobiales bacterium]
MGKRILVAGTINTDLVVRTRRAPEAGETVTGLSFAIYGGGKGANQAVAAARAGGSVSMLSGIGDDEFGRQRRADLEAESVDTTAVITTDRAASGVASITLEESGQNRIAYVPGAGWEVEAPDALAALDTVEPEVVLSTLELKHPTLAALFQQAKARAITLICNGTPEPSEGRHLISLADVLIVNEQEALELSGSIVQDWAVVAARIAETGPRIVIVTLGAEGALVWAGGSIEQLPSIPVEVVDTTGAGDAFCGAFAAFYSHNGDAIAAARKAVVAGSLSVMRAGAQPSMPTLEEIESALQHRVRD